MNNRAIPMPAQVATGQPLFSSFIKEPDRPGGRLTTKRIREIFKSIFREAAERQSDGETLDFERFERLLKATPHSLRHTYGTRLAKAKASLPVIQDILGHSDPRTTKRYISVTESQMAEAVAKLKEI